MPRTRPSCQEQASAYAESGHGDRQLAAPPQPVFYSLASGILATAIGATVSLAALGAARIAIWCTVTGTGSVIAGLARDSGPVVKCWAACRRWAGYLAAS